MELNLLKPKEVLYVSSRHKGMLTFLYRQPGAMWRSVCTIYLWTTVLDRSYYTIRRVGPLSAPHYN